MEDDALKKLYVVPLLFVLGAVAGIFLSCARRAPEAQVVVAADPLESSIVAVTNTESNSGGTGWVTSAPSGRSVIVTNEHVCQVAQGEYVRIEDDAGNEKLKGILKHNFARDLCVVEGIDAPALTLAESAPSRFETLAVMGHPYLKPTTPSKGQFLKTRLSAVGFSRRPDGCPPPSVLEQSIFGDACVMNMELSLTTIAIYPGNSGSPVVNDKGEVVGVINSGDPRDNTGNFIPLPYVKETLNGL
jgi:serine protease Do